MIKPLVSVLMPVYNAAPYITGSLTSLLKQDYQELEIIIVNDACTDHTPDLISSFKDSRIKMLHNPANLGLAASLNRAIRESTGDYLARMDADDISLKERISKQVRYLQQHPETDVLGTAMQYFGASNYLNFFPETHNACKVYLLRNVCFGHPTVIFRKRVFDDASCYYNPEYRQYSEEYDLWCRLADRFQFANLKEPLLRYRTYPENIKSSAEEKRTSNSEYIRSAFLVKQLGNIDNNSLKLHNRAASMQKLCPNEWEAIERWFEELLKLNEEHRSFNQQEMQRFLGRWFFDLCYTAAGRLHSTFFRYLNSSWKNYFRPDFRLMLKFIVKNLIRQ